MNGLSGWQLVLLTLAIVAGASVLSLVVGAVLVRMGMHRPWVVRRASGLAEGAIRLVKRPLTVVVLDESGNVVHTELVPEIAQEPDYEAALAAL